MSECVRQALIMLFKKSLNEICLSDEEGSDWESSVFAAAIAELESLALKHNPNERPTISMPERR